MKKIYLLFCAAMMTLSAAQAKVIFHESFDAPNGTVGELRAGDTNTEAFFDGYSYEETRWWTHLGSSNYVKVAEGTLSYPGYQTSGFGNKAYLWSTGADDIRSLASKGVTSGKVYLSAIIHVDVVKANATPDYFLTLCDHANGYYLGRVYTKSVQENGSWAGFRLGVAKANDGDNYLRYTSEVFAPQTDMLVVIEYEFVAGEKNDIVRLYVNPTKETTSPTLECVQDTVTGGGVARGAHTQADAGSYGLFGVMLRQGTNTPKVYVDEIKVTTSWADVWVEKQGGEVIEDTSVDNIAALKTATVYKGVLLKSQPVVVYEKNGNVALQDSTGAILVNDYMDSRLLNGVQAGDQLSNLTLIPVESEHFIDGLHTARLSSKTTPAVASSGNSVTPFEVTLADAAQYGPACVQLKNVEFVIGAEKKFTVGLQAIQQGEATADLNIPNGCNIIGEDLPAKASVKAIVVKNDESGLRLQISASADVTDRVAPSGTGMENIQKSEVSVQKVIRDGQLMIIRNGVIYTATGAEK